MGIWVRGIPSSRAGKDRGKGGGNAAVLSCFLIGVYFKNKQMFAHIFSLLIPGLHVAIKREKMGEGGGNVSLPGLMENSEASENYR